MLKKILVGTDFSDASLNMMNCLKYLKNCGTEEIKIVHCADIKDVGGLYISILNLLKPRMKQFEDLLKKKGFIVESEIPLGNPSYELNKIAVNGDFELIVIGTHGESFMKDILLGSVAHKTLQEAKKPVLLIPFNILAEKEEEKCKAICGNFFQHILYATDFSEVSEEAFIFLKGIVEITKSPVDLYHIQDKKKLTPHLLDKLEAFNKIDAERLTMLENELKNLGASKTEKIVEFGNVCELLTEKANSGKYSLLVMGNQGRSYIKEAFLGRVANYAVHHIDIPILMVPLWK